MITLYKKDNCLELVADSKEQIDFLLPRIEEVIREALVSGKRRSAILRTEDIIDLKDL